jgi:nucleotide sugar dehydrogenase
MKIGIIGLGFVGKAIYKSFKEKNINVLGYDIKDTINTFEECLISEILFLCLPTQFNEITKCYDKSIIENVLRDLNNHNYNGLVVIKSTIEPLSTDILQEKFSSLKLFHNPEFLSAATAYEDFHHQSHIVLGKSNKGDYKDLILLEEFYHTYYPDAKISLCSSTESESMKIYLNSFYAVKIQFFNELYLLCDKTKTDYNNVLDLMLKNNWINPMHTKVPGNDGKLSYGGYCFPKDTNALLHFMKSNESPCKVLEATINERNNMREDKINIISNNTNNINNINIVSGLFH